MLPRCIESGPVSAFGVSVGLIVLNVGGMTQVCREPVHHRAGIALEVSNPPVTPSGEPRPPGLAASWAVFGRPGPGHRMDHCGSG